MSLKTYHRLPSLELEVTDSIAAYCLDKAVLWFGMTVENLLGERVEVGTGKEKRWEAKYSLEDLLDPAFRVSRPLPAAKGAPLQGNPALLNMMAMTGGNVVKRWTAIKAS